MSNDLVSATRLASMLQVDRSTVHRRIARGELVPATVVDGRPLFLAKDAEAYARGERPIPETVSKRS